MNARMVSLKRFAVHDGPGIRTTLFLKGCPLSCLWCHNPESIRREPELGIFPEKCFLCGTCVKRCPSRCHSLENGRHLWNRAGCLFCGACAEACENDAIRLYGKMVSVEDAAAMLLEDRMFYDASGGGVTLSGGEPLLQADFCAELFRRMRQEKISCALDTCGYVSRKALEQVLPVTDLFLYDLKHMDPVRHAELTGVSNERILENLRFLSECGIPVEIRIPLVPGLNSEEENLNRCAEFLAPLKTITKVRILPYHSLSHSKYAAVGRPDTLPEVPGPSAEEIQRAEDLFRGIGTECGKNPDLGK